MWWKKGRIASFLLFLILWQIAQPAAQADRRRIAQSMPTQITSVVQDSSGNFVLLNFSGGKVLAAPAIRFLPTESGVVMVADFQAALSCPPALLAFPGSPVSRIRVGQFQLQPPVLRISFMAKDENALRQIDFRSSPGSLIVKLPEPPRRDSPNPPIKELTTMPPPAPDFKPASQAVPSGQSQPDMPQLRGPIVLRSSSNNGFKVESESKPKVVDKPKLETAPATAPSISKPPAEVTENGPKLGIAVSGCDPFTVTLTVSRPAEFRCFQLEDPGRYVIDIPGLDHPVISDFPEPVANPWIKGIRIGNPDGEEKVTRVVLDLSRCDAEIVQREGSDKASLAITMQKKNEVAVSVPKEATVVLDAGHGGSDPGAQRGDIQEKEITLSITYKLKRALEAKGVRVLMTRADDSFVSLEDRVKLTNSTNPHAFLSVHINSLESNNNIHGIETYFFNEQSKSFANLIHGSLVKELNAPDRAVRKARFYVIHHTPLPAVLAEVGFISNKDERAKLISSDYQEQVAQALADGVILYLSNKTELARRGTLGAANSSETPKSFTQILHSHNSGTTTRIVAAAKIQEEAVGCREELK